MERGPTGDMRVIRMFSRIRALFPGMSTSNYRLLRNRVTNKLRKVKSDCYEIDISNSPRFDSRPGYYNYLEVQANGYTVYLRLRVD